jgi:hypothetical protein
MGLTSMLPTPPGPVGRMNSMASRCVSGFVPFVVCTTRRGTCHDMVLLVLFAVVLLVFLVALIRLGIAALGTPGDRAGRKRRRQRHGADPVTRGRQGRG